MAAKNGLNPIGSMGDFSMMLSILSAAVLGTGFPATLPVEQAGIAPTELEAALTVAGWDIVHVTQTPDGGRVIGARAQDGWPVIHTLSSCEYDRCAVWSQTVSLEEGLLERSVSMSAFNEVSGSTLGSSLIGQDNGAGELTLKGAMIGRVCDSDCQTNAIADFASATRTSYRGLSGQQSAASVHLGADFSETASPAVPMDHRQIAAIVSATEDEADRQKARFLEPSAERTWTLTSTTGTGTISFPPLLPE